MKPEPALMFALLPRSDKTAWRRISLSGDSAQRISN